MTTTWADYLISKVRYNERETHIVRVIAHIDKGETLGPGVERTREEIVGLLGVGYTFVTIFKQAGTWRQGAPVRVVTIDGEKYIRTDADNTKADNLGELPRF